jgi:hypothetical protein
MPVQNPKSDRQTELEKLRQELLRRIVKNQAQRRQTAK